MDLTILRPIADLEKLYLDLRDNLRSHCTGEIDQICELEMGEFEMVIETGSGALEVYDYPAAVSGLIF